MHGWPCRCLLFSLLLLNSWCFGQQFSKSPAAFTGLINSKVVFGDFNNDGHTDVLVVGSTLGGAPSVLYKNDGAGNFTAVNNTLPRGDGEVELNDYDRDGKLDILMTQAGNFFSESRTYLLKNKGNFVFEAATSFLPNLDIASFGDYDNDGDPDALMVESSSHDIYQNNNGAFSAIRINQNAGALFAGSAEWMDYDTDGDLDYFVTDRLSNRLVVFRNDGFEQFTSLPVGRSLVNIRDAKWVNINNDGLPDILMSGNSTANSSEFFEVLLQLPDHQFQTLNYTFEGFSTGEALPFDADNDGDMDLLIAGARTGGDQMSLALLYTNSGGAFTPSNSGLPPMRNVSIASADVDHDNDLDIIITGALNAGPNDFTSTFLYLNTGIAKNIAPQPPVSPAAVVDGQKVAISWAPGTDAETPSGGLTYNLYVGTSPSNYNVLAPLASDGFVKAARFANAGFGLSRIVENLSPGTYYYRVQTIDGAQAASALTDEKQFTVLAEPPVINGFSPTSALQGATIRVSGKNFSNTSQVSINDVPASFRIVNSSSMMVTVPSVKWSGKIKITTAIGTVTSVQDFCEKPKPTEISGELQPCFGLDKVYKVQDPLDGLVYHWTVDNGATIVAQDGGEITVRFQKAGGFQVTVYPESCVAGDPKTLFVDAQGPPTIPINGPADVLSDVTRSFNVADSYRGYGFIFEWQKDGVTVASGVDKNLTGISWSDPGVHTVTMYLQFPPNSYCATSRAESKLTVNVSLNQYSLGQKILLDGASSLELTLAADLDGDGDDDLLNGARIFENTGGTLVARASFATMGVASITPLDIDNDNDVDLLMRGTAPSDGRLFRNNGNLSFTQIWTTTSITNNESTPVAIDYNIDGKIDLAANGYIFDNAANGFGSPRALLEPGAGVFTDVIDFNRDGYPDILTNNGMLHVNSGLTAAGFHLDYSLSYLSNPGTSTASFHYADMNSDEVDDVLFGLNHRIGADFQDDNGVTELTDTGPADGNIPLYADFNLDGIRDVLFGVLGNVYAQGYIYQQGANKFKKAFELTSESAPFNFLDIDGDGKDELLSIYRNFATDPSHYYIAVNTNNSQKPVVQAPANLTSNPGTSSVNLSWDATIGYTYNVAVGSAPGTTDIVSPLADLSSGHGFIHSRGNARINFLKLDLPPGTYFWSVQSIHAAGTRSAFSNWDSFTVDPRPGSPSNLKFSTEPQGTGVRWTDNESSETGFLVERKSAVGEPFISVENLPANSTQFIDPGGDTSSETFYRVTAQVGAPPGLASKVGGTGAALVHRFPYNENFEKQPTFPIWKVDPSDLPFAWLKISSTSQRKNGKYSMMGSGGALISPEFDLTGLEYPTLKFIVLGGFSGPGGIVQSSIDGGQTWSNVYGVEYPPLYYDPEFSAYSVKNVPKNSSVKFRIKSGAFALIDDISVVNAPAPVQGLTVTQSAQGEAHLEWNDVPDATHYFISRTPSTGTLYIDTVAAPLHSAFDHNVTTPNTYKYQVLAYSKTVNEYAFAYSSLEPVTLTDIPFSVQSVDPVSMQVNGLKEIPLRLHAGSTPVSQVTVTASSSNPEIQDLTVVRNGEEVSVVIQADDYVGETTITISASFSALSDSKSFKVTVYPQTAAPTGNSAQSFCYNSTVGDLAVAGTFVKWFGTASGGTALPVSTSLENGMHYYASQTLNGFESTARLGVVVSIGTAPPTAISSQSFCHGATVANLSVTGTAVKWYNAPIGGASFASTAPLVDGLHYYALQTLNGCASLSRMDVTVSVGSPAPGGAASQSVCFDSTVASLAATGTAIKWYSTATDGSSLPPFTPLINGAHYHATQTVNGCESLARLDVVVTVGVTAPTGPSSKTLCTGATVSGLPATGSGIRWYSMATGGSALATSTLLVNGAHYYASQTVNGCESQSRLDVAVTIGLPAPTGPSAQVFCSGATLSSLQATGTTVKWYALPFGGSPLSSAATLTDGSHYYASQTVNTCQSPRLDVIVSLNVVSKPTGNSLQSLCPGSTIANLTVAGADIKWYNAVSGGAALAMTDLLINNAHYFASQTIGDCESDRLDVTASLISNPVPTGNASQSFCPGSILANVLVSGSSVKWYDSPSGGAPISLSTMLEHGTHYYATQTVSGCESQRLDIFVSLADTPKPSGQGTQTFCAGAVIGNLLISGTAIRWYGDATGGAALPPGTPLTTTQSLYATQTVNGCESTGRLKVTVTVSPVPAPPAGEAQQSLDKGKTLADLSVAGANIKWYATHGDIAAKNTLPSGTTLVNAVYYATQSVAGCESGPLAVTVTVKEIITGIESEGLNHGPAIYPNPVGDELTVTHDGIIDNIIVINQFGQHVVNKSIHAMAAKLDVSGLAKGVYTVQVHTRDSIVTIRVMKL